MEVDQEWRRGGSGACAADAHSRLEGIPRVDVWPLDLADPLSIDAFAQRYLDTRFTGVARHLTREEVHRLGAIDEQGHPIVNPAIGLKTPDQGAATQVWCATSAQLQGLGGLYCEDVNSGPVMATDATKAPLGGQGQAAQGVRDYAIDRETAIKLWKVSEEMIGLHYPGT